ncbi:CHASE domain-containing protein [Simiduia aestuariiviva]|uniref:histidine kinase n=1 Tax=Simiduia aestuariiviva TaxID=1510459 RepID=A0A839UJV3_9GAMM|nr:CHASE domain-containing protein [Simiduia aestuariiviva]MBB3167051.1 hypothetical protein [Simiduia aestuariiviva]
MGLPLTAKPPWLVLLISVSVSFFAAYVTEQQARKTGQARFERYVEKLTYDIVHQLDTYSSLLRAGVGIFYASETVSRSEWGLFVGTLEVDRFYPGVQGIGYAAYLRPEDKAPFEAAISAEGFERFSVSPAGEREFYVPVTYLEPFTWRNQRAFGYDMFSEPARRKALERARDTGEASITGHVTLVQETEENVQAGFLMYVPVYQGKANPGTRNLRRDSIQGYVYAPFRMGRLLEAITKGGPKYLYFRITDGGLDGQTLYDSDPRNELDVGEYEATLPMEFGGREWTMLVRSTAMFDAAQSDNSTYWVLTAGLLDSFLLFAIVLGLVNNRRAAQQYSARMEHQLAVSEKFRQMADVAPTGLVAVDPLGNIELCNQRAVAMLGGREEDIVHHPIASFIPNQTPVRAAETARMVTCRSLTGIETPVELSQREAVLNGLTFMVYSLVDMTERKRQEDLLWRKTRELEQFVYAVSHDLKSPLVAITGLAEMLSQQPALLDDQENLHLLQRITANSRQMEQLLKDLLALSRVSHQSLALEFIELDALFEELRVRFWHAFEAEGALLEFERSGRGFWGHQTLILQLFSNLLGNALNYRDRQRQLKVKVTCKVARTGRVSMAVSDNGVGIDSEWQQKVFQLFTRRDSLNSSGSGLGLSICQAVVERHQGRIWLDSEVDVGTTFFVEIPSLKE